ncbi:MAG: hypothetical protein HC802_01415 [Caldilineaceae bacterium]|nr:hypothetical protein [Caldilineaceae bacterium]
MHTLALVLHKRHLPKWPGPRNRIDIVGGSQVGIDAIVGFLRCAGAKKQFAPSYSAADFSVNPARVAST